MSPVPPMMTNFMIAVLPSFLGDIDRTPSSVVTAAVTLRCDAWSSLAQATRAAMEPHHRLRLLIEMAQGAPGQFPEAWRSYARVEDARASAVQARKSSQVLRVGIVEDGSGSTDPLRFVE